MSVAAVLSALAAIPAIAGYVEKFVSSVMLWYVSNAQATTLAGIADAAALAAHAKTNEERYAAAKKWQEALSRPRISL